MNIVSSYVLDMVAYMLFATPFVIIIRFIIVNLLKTKNIQTTLLHEIFCIIFFVFMIGLASQTILPDFHLENDMGDINLELFKIFRQTHYTLFVQHYWSYFLINFLGNILIFIPIGLFMPLLWKKFENGFLTVFLGFSTSLFIEISQLFLPRRTDVDDLWLNTLGTFIGYLLFLIIKYIFPEIVNKSKIYKK